MHLKTGSKQHNFIFTKIVVSFWRFRPHRLLPRALPSTPLGARPLDSHYCPATLNDFPPPIVLELRGCYRTLIGNPKLEVEPTAQRGRVAIRRLAITFLRPKTYVVNLENQARQAGCRVGLLLVNFSKLEWKLITAYHLLCSSVSSNCRKGPKWQSAGCMSFSCHQADIACHNNSKFLLIFSEREQFTFAICCRPSVCRL